MKPPSDEPFVIHSYTRRQAIDDGVLVDLTAWAKETGFRIPVACTHAVWAQWIEPPTATASEHGQSVRGRAHDMLWMLFVTILSHTEAQAQTDFEVLFLDVTGTQQTVKLKAMCGPGDQAEPVVTIMLPSED